VHRAHDSFCVVRPGDREHRGVRGSHHAVFCAQATGDDDAPVLCQSLSGRAERLLDRGVDEAAGVDDDQIGAGIGLRGLVTLGAQLRQDALGIDQRFRTA